MKAAAVIAGCFSDVDTPVDNATFVVDFTATEDPRQGQIMANVSLLLSEAQEVVAIKQAVADYINQQRGSNVIAPSEVRLP